LSDLTFIEAKCRAERIYELLEDFDRPVENHPCLPLRPVRKAVALSLGAIAARTDLTLQTVFNYLAWQYPQSPEIQRALERARTKLDQKPFWIRSAAPLPDALATSDWRIEYDFSSFMQSLSSDRSHLAMVDPEGKLIVRNLLYGKEVDHRELDGEQIRSMAVAENPRRLAWLDQGDKIHSNVSHSTATIHPGETNILYHPEGGIIFVNADAALVCWQPQQQETTIIFADFPTPIHIFRFTHDGNHIVYAAGNSPAWIGIIDWNGNGWNVANVPFSGVPLVDLDYDPQTQTFVLLQKNRSVGILNLEQKVVTQQIFYEVEVKGKSLELRHVVP